MRSRSSRTALPAPPAPPSKAVGEGREGGLSPEISFIVCTRNRAVALELCIRSIAAACRRRQDCRAELVIVDDGSTDGTLEHLSCLMPALGIVCTVISTRHRGLAAARNTGLEAAQGRIVAFVDDDCELDPEFVADLERHYGAGAEQIVRGGRVELADPKDLPFTIKAAPSVQRFSPDVHPGGFVLGCNMTMPREVARRIGRFDERFGVGAPLRSAEDTDYLVRAFLLGIPIEYVPDMAVFHRHGRQTRAAVEALHKNYSLGNGGLCIKHFWRAPWLLRHFLWTQREAFRELAGGPRFDRELDLSHWPIVLMNLLGALRFTWYALVRGKKVRRSKNIRSAEVWPRSLQ